MSLREATIALNGKAMNRYIDDADARPAAPAHTAPLTPVNRRGATSEYWVTFVGRQDDRAARNTVSFDRQLRRTRRYVSKMYKDLHDLGEGWMLSIAWPVLVGSVIPVALAGVAIWMMT